MRIEINLSTDIDLEEKVKKLKDCSEILKIMIIPNSTTVDRYKEVFKYLNKINIQDHNLFNKILSTAKPVLKEDKLVIKQLTALSLNEIQINAISNTIRSDSV